MIAIASISMSLVLSQDTAPVTLKPPPLQKGDTVGLVAPASPLDEPVVQAAVENLRKSGYAVKLSLGYRQARGYLAASDEVRAAELNGFFADPEVKAIVCLRGGYGSPRILDRVDYDLLRRQPKILVGYSDITALLNAVHARAGLVVFHGPMGKEFAGAGGLSPFTAKYFWDVLQPSSPLAPDWGRNGDANGMRTLAGGVAEGVLVGGNLSVVTSTLGTPYELRCQGAVLFLEEVSEKPFRIDRMLNQLRLSGKLGQLKGVLLGSFTGCQENGKDELELDEVFADYFKPLGVPVLAGFPAGHVADQATLPIGVRVRLDATAKKLSLLESAVETR
jgi:muramoyltetrapeptide carboxypeptidase